MTRHRNQRTGAGIGFTVSLFIADLAYADPALTQVAKVGIFAGSLIAAVVGALVLFIALRRKPLDKNDTTTTAAPHPPLT